MSEEERTKAFRRLAYLERLAKLTQQLQLKQEVALCVQLFLVLAYYISAGER